MINLTVNTRDVSAAIEPRTHLADFLREGLNLTGTHLGCEHGVCGACTLLLDEVPARSCIIYAVACAGARVTTIEGLDDDEIMIELRAAFAREHALQCGYCTPGMLISARDLVLRLPTADERGIRVGMSGNLCRCTGYVGIIRAIRSVIEARRGRGVAPIVGAGRNCLGPAGSGHGLTGSSGEVAITSPRIGPSGAPDATMPIPDFTPGTILERQFEVSYPPAKVFEFFGDPAAVAACLPGASLTGTPAPGRIDGAILVRLGPISAKFQGAARIERDPATLSGRIVGIGNDNRSRSSTQGEIRYRLEPLGQGAATQVNFSIGYSLRGMLAQFARPGVVSDLAERMTADFAGNLDRALSGLPPDSGSTARSHSLNVFALLGDVIRRRARRLLLQLRGPRSRND
jgi:aerobic carbon-monoxide dehydrogenase small subunit